MYLLLSISFSTLSWVFHKWRDCTTCHCNVGTTLFPCPNTGASSEFPWAWSKDFSAPYSNFWNRRKLNDFFPWFPLKQKYFGIYHLLKMCFRFQNTLRWTDSYIYGRLSVTFRIIRIHTHEFQTKINIETKIAFKGCLTTEQARVIREGPSSHVSRNTDILTDVSSYVHHYF